MSKLVLLHNPRCAKSRQALALLQDRGVAVEVVEYLKRPWTMQELQDLRRKLGAPPSQWVRKKEKEYMLAGLGPDSSEEEILAAMVRYPILIERPILVRGTRAVVGRPPERVLELLSRR